MFASVNLPAARYEVSERVECHLHLALFVWEARSKTPKMSRCIFACFMTISDHSCRSATCG